MRAHRRRRLTGLALCAVLVAGAASAGADETPTAIAAAREAARRFVVAFGAGDEAGMGSVAENRAIEEVLISDTILSWHGKRVVGKEKAAIDFLAAAAAYAERVKSRPETRGFSRVVEAWRRLSRDDLERDDRLRSVFGKIRDAEKRKATDEVLALVEGARADLANPLPSASVVSVRGAEFRALRAAGRLDEAVTAARAAARAADDLRWPAWKAVELEHVAEVEASRERHAAAAAAYEEALAIREEFGSTRAAAWIRVLLCRQWYEDGRLADALAMGERALAEPAALGKGGRMGALLLYLGDIRRDLDQTVEARDLYDRSVVAYEAAGRSKLNFAIALDRAAATRLTFVARDLPGAEERYARVIAAAGELGNRRLLAGATLGLGRAARERGAHGEAVEILRRAVELAVAAEDGESEMLSLAALGVTHLQRSEPGPAIEALERAIRTGEKHRLAPRMYGIAYRQLARAYRLADRPRDAVRAAQAGVAIRRGRARDLGEVFGASAQRGGREAADIGVLSALRWAAVEPRAKGEAVAAAFALVEAARGALLADALAGGEGAPGTPPTETAEEAESRKRFEQARRRLLVLAFGDGSDDAALAAARKDYEAESDARREVLARAALRRGDATRPAAEPATLDAARAALPEGALLVLYHATDERLVAVAVARDGAELVDLGEARPVLEAALAWRAALASPDGAEGALPETLYDALLAPLGTRLRDAKSLLVSRDSTLSFVPIEALVVGRDGEKRRAIESWPIAYVPSATVYTALSKRAGAASARDTLIALGDPVYPGESGRPDAEASLGPDRGLTNLDRLAASAEEVRDVAARFPEARRVVLLRGDATRARLTSAVEAAAGRLRLLHVACHGFADARLTGRSGLVLSDADVLTVDDVARLRVPADLVVLSACESGKGRTRQGEGVLGLPRAFLAAGATRVVAADRAIADADARALLKRFYDAHLKDGLEPAAALRAAKVARIREGGPAAHPYAWAGLVLWE
jgi:CHAT domain-containing protein